MIPSFQTGHARTNSNFNNLTDIQIALRTDGVMNILHPCCVSFTCSFKIVCTPSPRSNNWEMHVKCKSLKYSNLLGALLHPNALRIFYSLRTAVPSPRFPFMHVQYCDIMRFTVLHHRHHKVSQSVPFFMHCKTVTILLRVRGHFVMSFTKNHESHYFTVLDNPQCLRIL